MPIFGTHTHLQMCHLSNNSHFRQPNRLGNSLAPDVQVTICDEDIDDRRAVQRGAGVGIDRPVVLGVLLGQEPLTAVDDGGEDGFALVVGDGRTALSGAVGIEHGMIGAAALTVGLEASASTSSQLQSAARRAWVAGQRSEKLRSAHLRTRSGSMRTTHNQLAVVVQEGDGDGAIAASTIAVGVAGDLGSPFALGAAEGHPRSQLNLQWGGPLKRT